MMSGSQVLGILDALAGAGVDVWVDGGWGVDALLGEQTREHEDLDLVIALADGDKAEEALAVLGFALSEDERPTRFVLGHDDGRRIDFHTVVFDAAGGGVQRLQDGRSYRYPPEGFAGEGVIRGRVVRCLTPEVQVECHLGYEPDETDRHDMRLLAGRFGLRLGVSVRTEQRGRPNVSHEAHTTANRRGEPSTDDETIIPKTTIMHMGDDIPMTWTARPYGLPGTTPPPVSYDAPVAAPLQLAAPLLR